MSKRKGDREVAIRRACRRHSGRRGIVCALSLPCPPRLRLSCRVSHWCNHGPSHRDGPAGFARETPRLRVSVLGDLRRTGLGVGLRSAGCGAQEEPEGALVARHGPRTGGHRGPGRRHPDAFQGVGGFGARGGLHRSAGGLQAVQEPVPRGRRALERDARDAGGALPGVRQQGDAHRASGPRTRRSSTPPTSRSPGRPGPRRSPRHSARSRPGAKNDRCRRRAPSAC